MHTVKIMIMMLFLCAAIYVICKLEPSKLERKFCSQLDKRLDIIFFVFVSILACYVRVKMFNHVTDDYTWGYKQWYDILKQNGGIWGLKNEMGNYPEGYMLFLAILSYLPINPLYGIKCFSVFFDFATAFMARRIILENIECDNKKLISNIVYTLLLLEPTILLNSAYWGQTDSIYTFFIVCSIWLYLKQEWNWVFICLGLGCAFKVQTLLILPVYLILYLKDRSFSILKLGLIPLAYVTCSIPACIVGKSFIKLFAPFLSYGDGTTQDLTYSFNNFYTLIQTTNEDIIKYLHVAGVGITLALVSCSMVIFAKMKYNLTMYTIIALILYFVLLITYFLPGMHERYLYVGDVLCIVWWALSRKRCLWYIPTGILLFSTLSYLRYVTNVWPGEEWNIITELNGLVSFVYFFFLFKTLLILYSEIRGR